MIAATRTERFADRDNTVHRKVREERKVKLAFMDEGVRSFLQFLRALCASR
jgi:hypothetical protein